MEARGAGTAELGTEAFEVLLRQGGSTAILEASRFLMQKSAVHDALTKIAQRLTHLGIPYAVVGGMALVAHGYNRTTSDVDVLVTAEGLHTVHDQLVGLGYRPVFDGSRHLRDTENGVRIEFLVTGDYPGDGKPKSVAFPDPTASAVERGGVRYLKLPILVELKLASGITNPGRLKDLADVQELIRVLDLKDDLADELDPFVREKYLELRRGVAADRD